MRPAITFNGKTGAGYSFSLIEHQGLLARAAGCVIYVRQFGDERTVLFIGNCNDLMAEAEERWAEAVSQHGATHIYVRRTVLSRDRQLEQEDLVGYFEPVMNGHMPSAARKDEIAS